MKKIGLFIITLIIFSFWIYIFKNYFLWTFENDLNNNIEENYIEPIVYQYDQDEQANVVPFEIERDFLWSEKDNNVIDSHVENNSFAEGLNDKIINDELSSAKEYVKKNIDIYGIKFLYFPIDFEKEVVAYTNSFNMFLQSELINKKIDSLNIEIYKEKSDVRGKMKNHRIKLYWVQRMSLPEYTAVWIHEFAHIIDLYYFQKRVFIDISDFFYNISWDWDKVIKSWQIWSDFVSGYAMTNKYEDFAETFTYYILHNGDFLKKSEDSEILKKKYDFFGKYLFKDWGFAWTNFSTWEKIKTYYRDITKINYSMVEFLKFLK